ncbi:hypothetical protein OOZ63_04175 [Paucibacter sp. PLA-PC-4]|uniref:hypothetical protein n=1 Tax=Paucibacter sp. PLA-PC-4 TaxID=2993655 RepID=UPI0022497C04|nr:hypothetical protein [Paucibacter sp. PLA-PC-4]MCX2861031.1 hypothetical protein [Paucibacter sp. PLA-PC-4]
MNSNDRDRKKKWQLEKKLAARAAFSMPDALVVSLFDTVGFASAELAAARVDARRSHGMRR